MKYDTSINANIKAILPYLGFALIVFSIKLIIIAHYGNATPYWDQWDAEADNLYRPLLEGNLTWANMLAPHNEHRIFTTRLLAIALLYLNGGVWNPILQMQVSAGIHVLALTLLLYLTAKALTPAFRNAMLVLCTIVFSIPFGWENTLAGFQVQFYFLLLFSFIFLWSTAAYKTYSSKWWLGFMAGLLSPLSLASGALILVAGGLILVIRRLLTKNKKEVAITSIVLLFILAGIFIVLTPTLLHPTELNAHSLLQFFNALLIIFSWPDVQFGIGVAVIHIPILLLCFAILCREDLRTTPVFFIVAITLCLFGQFVAIAYGRTGSMAGRYLDLFAIGLVANFAALAILFNSAQGKIATLIAGFWGFWIATITFGFASSVGQLHQDLKTKLDQGLNQEKNVRTYLCSGDFSYLQNKPFLYIPYPDPNRLKMLLDNPTIRNILPSNIYSLHSKQPLCNPMDYKFSFRVLGKAGQVVPTRLVNTNAIVKNEWLGTDYYSVVKSTSTLPGFKVIGSFKGSDTESGALVLHLHKGDQVWFRSEPRAKIQTVVISGLEKQFSQELPIHNYSECEWLLIEFSNSALPNEFDVKFVDGGGGWGEWSAIGFKN